MSLFGVEHTDVNGALASQRLSFWRRTGRRRGGCTRRICRWRRSSEPEDARVGDLMCEGVLEGVFEVGEDPGLVEELGASRWFRPSVRTPTTPSTGTLTTFPPLRTRRTKPSR